MLISYTIALKTYQTGESLQKPSLYLAKGIKEKSGSRLQDIVIRGHKIALFIICLTFTLPLYLLGAVLKAPIGRKVAHYSAALLKNQIQELRKKNGDGWREKALKFIKRSRFDDPELELSRLRKTGALTPEREAQLKDSINRIAGNAKVGEQSLILMAQAMEIKDIYKETHDVFIHAQMTNMVVLIYLIKELVKKFRPEVKAHQFKFLRNPKETLPKKPAAGSGPAPDSAAAKTNALWDLLIGSLNVHHNKKEKEKEKEKNKSSVQAYVRSEERWGINDDNMDVRDKLLSVDGYFYNFGAMESTQYFLVNNTNILLNKVQDFCREVIKDFCPKLSSEDLAKYSLEAANAFNKIGTSGNLFAIAIPKDKSDKMQYRAHPFGPVCRCHRSNRRVLDRLQNEIFGRSERCNEGHFVVPQFRIYTPLLTPESGSKIYLLTPLAQEERKAVKGKIKQIVKQLKALSA